MRIYEMRHFREIFTICELRFARPLRFNEMRFYEMRLFFVKFLRFAVLRFARPLFYEMRLISFFF